MSLPCPACKTRLILSATFPTRLDAADIGYMLTGSMALNCYALPCVPHNLDFVVALRPADAEIMVRLFNPDYDISREAVDSAIAQHSFSTSSTGKAASR